MSKMITQAKLAEILGVSSARITQVRATGRLDGTWVAKGRTVYYDKDAAIKAWNYENATQQDSTRKPTSELEIPSFNESRAKTEYFRAEMARLDLEEKEELRLINAVAVRHQLSHRSLELYFWSTAEVRSSSPEKRLLAVQKMEELAWPVPLADFLQRMNF